MLNGGYVNSWVDTFQDRPAPCIGQSVNENPNAVSGLGPISDCWLWLLIGVVGVLLLKENKR